MAPKIKIVYFEFMCRAETPRLILSYAGVPFEDKRVTEEEWDATVKQSPVALVKESKKSTNFSSPFPAIRFGKLPVMEYDGMKMCQSLAISRFLAREHGLAGKDSKESALADMYAECASDLMDGGY